MSWLPFSTGQIPAPLQAWLLTYLLHSTLLLLIVWCLTKLLGERGLELQEQLWRVALFGAVATSLLQVTLHEVDGFALDGVALGFERRGWHLELDAPSEPGADAVERAPSTGTSTSRLPPPPSGVPPIRFGVTAPASADASPRAWRPDPSLLAAAWILLAPLLLGRLALHYWALYRRLRGRRPVNGLLRHRLDQLLGRVGFRRAVALNSAAALDVPVALGVARPEICLPEHGLGRLSADEEEAVLAHELAHHRFRDPAWLLATRTLETLLFFQPLNRLARRRLQELAELRCDAWAAAAAGTSLPLARSLTVVAGWRSRRDPSDAVALPLARRRSGLGRRIQRLLEQGVTMTPSTSPRWLPGLSAALLLVTVVVAPGVSVVSAKAPDDSAEAAIATTQQSPEEPAAAPAEQPQPAPAWAPPPQEPSAAPPPPASPSPATPPAAAPQPPSPPAAPSTPPPAPAPPVLDRELEQRLERMMAEVEVELEGLDLQIESQLESLLEGIDLQIETEVLEKMEVMLENLDVELDNLDLELEKLASEIDVEAITEIAQRAAGAARMSEAERKALAEEARRAAESVRPTAEEMRALAEEARRAAEAALPTAEEMRALAEEARRAAEAARPSLEEIRALAEEARRAAEAAMPDREELRALVEEAKRAAAEARTADAGTADAGTAEGRAAETGETDESQATPEPPPDEP